MQDDVKNQDNLTEGRVWSIFVLGGKGKSSFEEVSFESLFFSNMRSCQEVALARLKVWK